MLQKLYLTLSLDMTTHAKTITIRPHLVARIDNLGRGPGAEIARQNSRSTTSKGDILRVNLIEQRTKRLIYFGDLFTLNDVRSN